MTHIEFEHELLSEKDNNELLIQICLRLDRHFPQWEATVESEQALEEAKALIVGYANDLLENGFEDLAKTVEAVI